MKELKIIVTVCILSWVWSTKYIRCSIYLLSFRYWNIAKKSQNFPMMPKWFLKLLGLHFLTINLQNFIDVLQNGLYNMCKSPYIQPGDKEKINFIMRIINNVDNFFLICVIWIYQLINIYLSHNLPGWQRTDYVY